MCVAPLLMHHACLYVFLSGPILKPPVVIGMRIYVITIINIVINYYRPHRSIYTTHVGAAYCYRPSSVACLFVCLSVCLSVGRAVCHSSERCKNGRTDRDANGLWTRVSPKKRIRCGCKLAPPLNHLCTAAMRPFVKLL